MMEKWSSDTLADNLHRIRETIAACCAACGRREEEITLMAVTKTVPPERINQALALGVRCIGENRVQEYLGKRDALLLDGVQVHLIGHLQTNKAAKIVGAVDMIESIDTLHVAQAVDAASRRAGRVTDVLVEVNIGGETAKSGCAPEETADLLYQLSPLQGIRVRGLMTVAPILAADAQKRAVFSRMRKLFIDIRGQNIDNISMDVLSMGMSSDYAQAILEGATLIRVGSALFGERTTF